jgi:hypothetical protein
MKPLSAPNSRKNSTFRPARRVARRLTIVIGLAACAVGLYALAGWYGAPWLVERWLDDFISDARGRDGSIASVRFNPFNFEAELTGLDIRDDTAGVAFSAATLFVDISARSFRERRPVFTVITARNPVVELAGFDRLAAIVQSARNEGLLQSRIDTLEVNGGVWRIGMSTEQAIELADVAWSITGFDRMRDSDARYSLRALTVTGTSVESEGSLAADLERAAGNLRLDGAELETMATWFRGIFSRVEPRGRLALTAAFTATELLGIPKFELNDADVDLIDLSLQPLTGLSVTTGQASAIANLVVTSVTDGIDISGRLEANDTSFDLSDSNVMPVQTFPLTDTGVLITADPESRDVSINISARLDDADAFLLSARLPAGTAAASTVEFQLTDLPTATLSAYAAQSLGRGLDAGRADVKLEYSRRDERVSGELALVARGLVFLPPGAGEDSSLDLAAALLENAEGITEIELPFAGTDRSVRYAAIDALSARIAALTATPFDALQAVTAGDDQTTASVVPFRPGEAALSDRALATIAQLAAALTARPRLGLRVLAAYDPEADRTALAEQQIQLHVLLATAGPTAEARPRPVDFASPRAQDVLDEFAGERLVAERTSEIARLFDCGDGELESLCRRAYYAAIFDALVANEEISDSALNRLARFRALSIVDALTTAGIDAARLETGTGTEPIDSPFGIGLPIELTVAGQDG